jgi:predicted ATPase/DNA-binding SARP family transcriptional activator
VGRNPVFQTDFSLANGTCRKHAPSVNLAGKNCEFQGIPMNPDHTSLSLLEFHLLGTPAIHRNGEISTELTSAKAQALLYYLAMTQRVYTRTFLAGLLWGDQAEGAAQDNLRKVLQQLRATLGPALAIERHMVGLQAEQPYWVDAVAFTSQFEAALTADALEPLQQVIALYRGDFLEGFYVREAPEFEAWMLSERARLREVMVQGLATLAERYASRDNLLQAITAGRRLLALEPWREETHRQLMAWLAQTGQRSAALAQYERCREMLAAELGVEPSPETTGLYERIRANELDAPSNANPLALTRPHNLPVQPTPFLGRQQELATLAEYLTNPQCRLITLFGLGGIGKTRLALQAATEQVDAFAHGVTFVELAPLTSAEYIVPTLAAALRLTLAGPAAPQTQVLNYLRQQEMLLVLDNFEHLLPPASPAQPGEGWVALLADILRQAPGVTLLVTSRERLNVQGEWLFEVGALEMPPTAANQPGEGGEMQLEAYSAPALLLQTARRVQQGFEPTTAERAAIVRICHLVQGMPLALELAAAWVRMLSCREIAHEIAQGLELLTTTLRDLPERHRSLQAVFDHSWRLLSVEEQRVFACCSVFRGGFTREAAAEVAGASLSLLAALVDKSLLRRQLSGRYEVHELARQYAAQRLSEAQQEAQARHRHLEYFMQFAEAAEPHIRGGEQVVQWHEWMESEHDNLRAALDWSLSGGEIEPGLRIIAALWEFWMDRGHAPEGQSQAERFLVRPEAAAHPVLRAMAMHTAGVCAFYQGRYRAALVWLAEAAAIGRELGASGKYVRALALLGQGYTLLSLHEFGAVEALSQEALMLGEELQVAWIKGDALFQLARLAWQRGDYVSARQCFLECLACIQAYVMRGYVLQGLGTMLGQLGDYAAAQAYMRQSLAIHKELGDKIRSSITLTQLARLAMAQGNDGEAEELLAKALMLVRKTGHLHRQIATLDALGRLAQRPGDYGRARTLHEESLALCIEIEDPAQLAHALEAFACLAARQGQAEAAVRLFGATGAYAAPLEATFDPVWRLEHDQLVASARTQLGEAAFAAAWAKGQAMTLDEAVEYALMPAQT